MSSWTVMINKEEYEFDMFFEAVYKGNDFKRNCVFQ